jgi:Transposase DDE domain
MSIPSAIERVCEYGRIVSHAVRYRVLVAAVVALVRSQCLSLTAIGRAMRGTKLPKYGIKRIDRLLSNGHLYRERLDLFSGLAAKLLKANSWAVIALDWTLVGEQFAALVAAVPFGGRALPIYEETHPREHLSKRVIEERFLARLAAILPSGCKPILIADAGFRGPFCQAVLALGWHFVIRIRSKCHVRLETEEVGGDFHRFYEQATSRPKALGWGQFAPRGTRTEARFILYKKKRPSKKNKKRSRKPRKPPRCNRLRSGSQHKTRRGAIEPWFLATSLAHASAASICDLYATRMQIEETFRDTKNHRFGWSLRDARYRSTQRLDILFLLIALAMLLVTLLGSAAEAAQRHLGYQGNSIKTRRVLSWFVLGNCIIQHQETDWLNPSALSAALARCQAFQERLVASAIP